RVRPELARVGRRVGLVGAELVEVVVARDFVEGVRGFPAAQWALAYPGEPPVLRGDLVRRGEGARPGQQAGGTDEARGLQQPAAVPEHGLGRDLGRADGSGL